MKRFVLMILVAVVMVGCGKEEDSGVDMGQWMDVEVADDVLKVGVKIVGDGGVGSDVIGGPFEVKGSGSFGVEGDGLGVAVKGDEGSYWVMVEIGDRREYREVEEGGDTFVFDLEGCREVRIYGAVERVNFEGTKVVELDVAGNDVLCDIELAEGNVMTSEGWDRLFCSLGDRIGLKGGEVHAMSEWSDADNSALMGANSRNANARNWKVMCGWNEIATEGRRGCE